MNNVIILYGIWALSLIVMKLAEIGVVASWSWWIVLSPLWGPVVLVIVLAVWLSATGYRWHR